MSAELVDRFYNALAARDAETMVSCYQDDVTFEDPVFGVLNGKDAGDMWRMLCANATDMTLTHTVNNATETAATASWVAHYTFSATNRPVRNDVTAKLTIEHGKIIDHRDDFDFWKWSSQALGTPGRLLGWTPFLKAKVRKTTAATLATFQAEQAGS